MPAPSAGDVVRAAVDNQGETAAARDHLGVLDRRAAQFDLALLIGVVGELVGVDVVALRVVGVRVGVELVHDADEHAAVRLLRPVERPRVTVGDGVGRLVLGVGERLVAAVAVVGLGGLSAWRACPGLRRALTLASACLALGH